LKNHSLLDVALHIDENFVAHHNYCRWLPDVFQQYGDLLIQDGKAENRSWIGKLDEFKEKNNGRFLFLYFGTAQFRRGYDLLLKLAQETQSCFIHCGLRNNDQKYTYDINDLRSSLSKNGRLLETDQYIEDPLCVEYFFKSVSHLVLPYRHFFGSSGVMLQALSFGIPVMAPENGIMGYRIKKYKLGITYSEEEESSLSTQFNRFRKEDPKTFQKNIEAYMQNQTPAKLQNVLINAFATAGQTLMRPLLQKQ
jgi:hypothetical protein